MPLQVRGGTASFDAPTTVASINVHGKSTELDARASVRDGAEGLALESVEATLPVRSLATGMGVRDAHMRKLVFTGADGSLPDVTFVSRGAACAPDQSKRQSACVVWGELVIRGISRPFTMTLTVSRNGRTFHASGDGLLKLTAYGIEPPAEFGVRVSDAVKLHLDFTARPAVMATAQSASR
jgi:polyisoprenoid-binding protein YceI